MLFFNKYTVCPPYPRPHVLSSSSISPLWLGAHNTNAGELCAPAATALRPFTEGTCICEDSGNHWAPGSNPRGHRAAVVKSVGSPQLYVDFRLCRDSAPGPSPAPTPLRTVQGELSPREKAGGVSGTGSAACRVSVVGTPRSHSSHQEGSRAGSGSPGTACSRFRC